MSANKLDELTSQWEPELRRAFLKSVRDIKDRAEIARIVQLLEQGRTDDVLDALGINAAAFQAVDETLEDLFRQGGATFARAIPSVTKIVFDARNRQAEEWIRTRSSSLITEIVDSQRATVRAHLDEGLQRGDNPRKTALDLVGTIDPVSRRREGGVIGMTTGQRKWNSDYSLEIASADPAKLRKAMRRKLHDKRFNRAIEKAIRDGKAIPLETQAKMRASYSNRTLKYRGDVVSRTETIQSLQAAQYHAYKQAIDAGELSADQVSKIWDSAGDARVRNSHAVLDNDRMPFNEPFLTIHGSKLMFPGDISMGARKRDIIQCRCIVRYEVDFEQESPERAKEKLFEKIAARASNKAADPGYFSVADRLVKATSQNDLRTLAKARADDEALQRSIRANRGETTTKEKIPLQVRQAREELGLLLDIQEAMDGDGLKAGTALYGRVNKALRSSRGSRWRTVLNDFYPNLPIKALSAKPKGLVERIEDEEKRRLLKQREIAKLQKQREEQERRLLEAQRITDRRVRIAGKLTNNDENSWLMKAAVNQDEPRLLEAFMYAGKRASRDAKRWPKAPLGFKAYSDVIAELQAGNFIVGRSRGWEALQRLIYGKDGRDWERLIDYLHPELIDDMFRLNNGQTLYMRRRGPSLWDQTKKRPRHWSRGLETEIYDTRVREMLRRLDLERKRPKIKR